VNVHLVQLDIEWEDPAANRARADRLISAARIDPGDLVLLPEMFDTGFSFNLERTADRDGDSCRFITDTAKRHRVTLIAGLTIIETDGRARNRAFIVGPEGRLISHYDKSRMFPLGSPSEADRLVPGDRIATACWRGTDAAITLSPLICYDLRFPELFLEGLRAGAEAFAVIANWPAVRSAHWRALLIARAIENQAYVFAVNRTGSDPTLRYAGGSLVVSPQGEVLAEAGAEETVLTAGVKRGVLDDWRARFPAWRDRFDR
jgi:predicted amidohydrolase